MFSFIKHMAARLRKENDGVALTEYLILLGLLTAAVVGAVIAFGGSLGIAWEGWADWIVGLEDSAPAVPAP